jgi:uncharacterized phage-like protein YoqJ
MNYNDRVCSFTGYRAQKLNICLARSPFCGEDLRALIRDEIVALHEKGYRRFQCGMAIGTDTMFAEIVQDLRGEYPQISMVAMVPCFEQDALWHSRDRAVYRRLLDSADCVVFTDSRNYTKGCMQKRNRVLVDSCDTLLAVYDGQPGGTRHTIDYAKRKGKKVIVLDPAEMVRITLFERCEEEYVQDTLI